MEVQRRRHRGGRNRTERRRRASIRIVNIVEDFSDDDIKVILGRYGEIAWFQRISHSPTEAVARFRKPWYCLF